MIDFDTLTERQREVLGLIAINQDGGHPRKTLESLMARDLIEEYIEEQPTRMGTFKIKHYVVPIHVHIAWCDWCSRHYKEEDGQKDGPGDDSLGQG